jgi:hypothetical protein
LLVGHKTLLGFEWIKDHKRDKKLQILIHYIDTIQNISDELNFFCIKLQKSEHTKTILKNVSFKDTKSPSILATYKKVWFLIFLTYSFSIGYVLQQKITTKIEIAPAAITQNHIFDSYHVVENNYTPFQIQQISSCPLQADISIEAIFGIFDYNVQMPRNCISIFDYDVKGRLYLIIKRFIFPHHTFW